MYKRLKKFDIENKKVLVRCDFNVPIEDGKVQDDFRIKKTLPTIEYLLDNNAKVILMSHLGKPEGEKKEELSLAPVAEKLSDLLRAKVFFVGDCVGEEVEKKIKDLKGGEVLVLENLRFYKEEEENTNSFAKELAQLADFYVNDAFGACHRAHASIEAITRYIPSAMGLLLEKEVNILSRVIKDPWRPLVAIIGGAKLESKTKMIRKLIKQSDQVLIGGKIANNILIVKGICVGRPWPEEKVVEEIKSFDLTSVKIHLPIDASISADIKGETYVREAAPGKARKDEKILDIGPETIRMFSKIIKDAKMIIWAGPMGLFEEPKFEKGTKEIADAITKNHQAFKIAGGGDTIYALSKFGLTKGFDHVSTGGGAMLAFLGEEDLPGLRALETNE